MIVLVNFFNSLLKPRHPVPVLPHGKPRLRDWKRAVEPFPSALSWVSGPFAPGLLPIGYHLSFSAVG